MYSSNAGGVMHLLQIAINFNIMYRISIVGLYML